MSIKTAPDFGYALRAAREEQGLTQVEVAARANVSVRWLSDFERGKSPRAELIKVVHVARALGFVFEMKKDQEEPTKRVPWATPGMPSPLHQSLTRINSRLTESVYESMKNATKGVDILSLMPERPSFVNLSPHGLPTSTQNLLSQLSAQAGDRAESDIRSGDESSATDEAAGDGEE